MKHYYLVEFYHSEERVEEIVRDIEHVHVYSDFEGCFYHVKIIRCNPNDMYIMELMYKCTYREAMDHDISHQKQTIEESFTKKYGR